MSSLYDSPSAESLEHMRDDKVLQKINDSYVRSLMKMMSSKVLKELRAENETIQKHLNALTKDAARRKRSVHLLAGEVSSVRAEDRSWHQDAMVAKLEALREDVQMSAAREKDFVNELGELRRKVEGRYEDLSAHYRHLDKDVRTSLREFRSEFSEEQQSSVKCLQDFRSSIRDLRSDLDEQRESLKVLQETDLMKHLGDARQVLADLQEERSWHHEAMKKLRESREEQKKSYEEEVSDLDKRSENFRQMLRSALPMELDKRDQSLTKQTEELFEKLQSWTQGQLDAYLDQARLLDQDILDKLNPDFLLMKDQLERLGDTVNQIASQVPALVLGDAAVREECSIFRSDIGKLSDEMVHMGESLRLVLPWVDWLREPGMRNLEERLAALEHLLTEGLNSQGLQGSRFSSFEKELQDQQRCTNELQAVCRKLPEDLESQRRKLLGLEVNLRKYLLSSEELKNWRQDFDSIRVRLKRCEVNQLQEQKNLKICQENCSRYRKACEDIYAKCHQETLQRGDSRNLKEYEDAYAKWRQDAVAWQQEQACSSACDAPEDPEKRVRLFSEHWSRVSSRAISHPERVEVVRLPGSHGCGNISRPLPLLPAGLMQMRQLLPKLFSGHCDMGEVEDWAHKANFILVDLSTGQALLVGAGVQLVLPDSSRLSMEDGSEVEATRGTEHLLQAQRLSRWLRKLPDTHRGWIVVVDEALSVWQQRFVQTGRRFPLLSPACISKVAAANGFKYRITPGTKWCGDGGWSHLDFFPVLRSGTNIPADKRVPICISYNRNGYYYRFENSVRGCVGKHKPTGTQWTHAQTIYTSRDANGTAYCVGMKEAGEHTRWTVQKAQVCADGFRHSFGFRAMHNDYTSPLVPCCILVALNSQLGSKETPFQRFAAGKECETSTEWRVVYKLVLLSRPIDAEHHRVCIAAGSSAKVTSEANSESDARDPHQVFRVFYDAACDKKSLVTFEGERKFFWDIGTEKLFLPHTATGIHLCLCHVVMSKLKTSQESVKKLGLKSGTGRDLPFYTWVESKCPKGAKKELCFNTMGPADVLNAVHLVDEVV